MNSPNFIQKYSIPNLVTLLRLLLAVYLLVYIDFSNINYIILVLIIAAIGLSDSLDGYLARKYNAVTKFGTIIDPFVDRAVFIIIMFWLRPIFLEYFFQGVILRDLLVLIGSVFVLNKTNTVKVSNLGKFATVLLFITICFYILAIQINFGIFIEIISLVSVFLYYFVALEYLYKQVLFSE